ILLLALAFGVRANHLPAVYFTNTNVDLNNRLIYGELVYDAPDFCESYELRFKTKVYRAGAWVDSAQVKPISSAIISNTNRYVLSNDSAITNLTASGYQIKATLPSGVQPTDSVSLSVEVYRHQAVKCFGCGVGGSNLTFTKADILADCPYPNKDNDSTLLACNRASTGAGIRWEAFIRDFRDCNIYRTVQMPDSSWWFAQNLNWGKTGKCLSDQADNCEAWGRLYRWCEAVTGEEIPLKTRVYMTMTGSGVGPQGVCPEGWHVPLNEEWHQLGVSIGSNAADPNAAWSSGALPHLMGFSEGSDSWATYSLRDADDAYGFRWTAVRFETDGKGRGIGGNSNIKYGALWSAGAGAGESQYEDSIKRVAASATVGSWAASPLTADTLADGGKAGSKGRDYLPVRCALGVGGLTTQISLMVPYNDEEEENPCSVGCLCGDAGAIGGAGCSAVDPGAIVGATVVACEDIVSPGVIGCFQ
ncbi:MAG: hypothetical protein LBK47_01100, partial [Prevotellaceae bacterium]|nr:hypothetical protein [Prevotellaceae bacterium]